MTSRESCSDEVRQKYPTLQSLVQAARRNVDDPSWDYLVGGTETETTVARNRAAYDGLALSPRVLRDMSRVDISGTFLGQRDSNADRARTDGLHRHAPCRRGACCRYRRRGFRCC